MPIKFANSTRFVARPVATVTPKGQKRGSCPGARSIGRAVLKVKNPARRRCGDRRKTHCALSLRSAR